MNMHKRIRLTPYDREEIWRLYQTRTWKVTHLAEHFRVSRPTIYKVLRQARLQQFAPSNSTNKRYKTAQFGIKRLAKVEAKIQDRLKKQAQRYNKSYPGELLHVDTKRLPLLKGQSKTTQRDYLFVAIDAFSRELYADILSDKSQLSSAQFLSDNVLAQCPYEIDYIYSDNGKAERVIRTIMEMWHNKVEFKDSAHRRIELNRFINFYNTVKPHKSLNNQTPYEILNQYFYNDKLYTTRLIPTLYNYNFISTFARTHDKITTNFQ